MAGCGIGSVREQPMGEELKAQQTAPTKTQAAPAQTSPKPRPGEILLSGTVVSIDVARAELVLQATSFTLPNGRSAALAQPKEKIVLVSDATTISPRGKTDKLKVGDLKAGDAVTASGQDTGGGSELIAREILLVTVRPIVRSEAAGKESTVELTSMNPPTLATLKTGEKCVVTVRYNNVGPNPVHVFAMPYTNGNRTPASWSSGSRTYQIGSGDVEGWFLFNKPTAVDEVKVTMVDSKTRETLLTKNIPVQLNWAGPVIRSDSVVATAPRSAPQPAYKPDYGEVPVPIAALPNPEPLPPADDTKANDAKPTDDKTSDIGIVSLKGPAKLSQSKEIILYANPGKNFKVDLTVKYKTPVAVKVAANLKLSEAKILPPELLSQMFLNHNSTWHFDTETRPGFKSVEGEGEMTFDLIGIAPKEKGKYTFTLNCGLFAKANFATIVMKLYTVTLITDKQLFDETDSTLPQPK